MLHIFTDGACTNNGKYLAKAAYSVVFWNIENTPAFGMAHKVPAGELQTNQRAELRGLSLAFDEIRARHLTKPITIWTDSEYGRKCITEWGPQWKVRGWTRANNNKPLENLDLIKPMIDFYEVSQHFIMIRHVKAHTNKQEFPYCGNEMADKLATECLK